MRRPSWLAFSSADPSGTWAAEWPKPLPNASHRVRVFSIVWSQHSPKQVHGHVFIGHECPEGNVPFRKKDNCNWRFWSYGVLFSTRPFSNKDCNYNRSFCKLPKIEYRRSDRFHAKVELKPADGPVCQFRFLLTCLECELSCNQINT